MNRSDIKIAIVGGDERMGATACELCRLGYECAIYGADIYSTRTGELPTRAASLAGALGGASVLILPLPFSRDDKRVNAPLSLYPIELTELFSKASELHLVAAGMANEELGALCSQTNAELFDYGKSEGFAIKNAVATAEGAISVAVRETPFTLSDSRCTLLGYGRIGKCLAPRLHALGAEVHIFARKEEDLCWVEANGFIAHTYEQLCSVLEHTDILFNTVPHLLLRKEELTCLGGGVLIELASYPGGVDLIAASAIGTKLISAPSLPGKFSPVSAGRIIAECVDAKIQKKVGDGKW